MKESLRRELDRFKTTVDNASDLYFQLGLDVRVNESIEALDGRLGPSSGMKGNYTLIKKVEKLGLKLNHFEAAEETVVIGVFEIK